MTTKVKKRGVSGLPFSVTPIEEYRKPEDIRRDIDNLKSRIQSLKTRRAGCIGDKVHRLGADGSGDALKEAETLLGLLNKELDESLAQTKLMEKDRVDTDTTLK